MSRFSTIVMGHDVRVDDPDGNAWDGAGLG
jgi:hypothetical protein